MRLDVIGCGDVVALVGGGGFLFEGGLFVTCVFFVRRIIIFLNLGILDIILYYV